MTFLSSQQMTLHYAIYGNMELYAIYRNKEFCASYRNIELYAIYQNIELHAIFQNIELCAIYQNIKLYAIYQNIELYAHLLEGHDYEQGDMEKDGTERYEKHHKKKKTTLDGTHGEDGWTKTDSTGHGQDSGGEA